MNLKALEQKLMATARGIPRDERVPYAFEKRVLAHLKTASPLDGAALWAKALWRATVPCVTLATMMCAWSLWQGALDSGSTEFSSEFETAALMSTDLTSDTW